MTRERELLQQALDALDRAISDDRAYIRECKDAAEAIRAHLAAQPAPVPLTDTETHAELWKRAVRKGLITVRSELIDPRKFHECRATTRRATSVTTLQPTASQHPRSSQNENN